MAEGEGDFWNKNPNLDFRIDNDDDDTTPLIDLSDEEVDTTRPFQPGTASTPYHDGEQHEMQTMTHEQSGLPSYEGASLFGAQNQTQRSWNALTNFFPEASSIDLETSYSKTGRLLVKMAGFGKKAYEVFTKDRSGRQQLNPKLTKEIKQSLGARAEQIIEEDRDTAIEQRQRVAEAEEQERQGNAIAAEREKEKQEIEVLSRKLEETQARIDANQEEYGSNIESEAELNRLKQLRKNYQKDLDSAKKRLASIEKGAKKTKAMADRERSKLAQIEKEKTEIEERLNSTKILDELKERENDLKRQNEEDQAIVQDENASPSEREAAEARVAERNEELDRLQTQVGEREAATPLRERVREIFKKYGVTVASIFIAAGVTIGAVVGAITNALKSMGKQLANGLKTVGAKAAAALPGLIGAVVSFLFKTAGQAIGYLAEHTWYLFSRRLFSFLKSTSKDAASALL